MASTSYRYEPLINENEYITSLIDEIHKKHRHISDMVDLDYLWRLNGLIIKNLHKNNSLKMEDDLYQAIKATARVTMKKYGFAEDEAMLDTLKQFKPQLLKLIREVMSENRDSDDGYSDVSQLDNDEYAARERLLSSDEDDD
jgi:hypothetical protein